MRKEQVPRVVDKNGNPIFLGDKVRVWKPSHLPINELAEFTGVIDYIYGTYVVNGLRDIEYNERSADYDPHNHMPVSSLRTPVDRDYISNYGEVNIFPDDNVIHRLEVIK